MDFSESLKNGMIKAAYHKLISRSILDKMSFEAKRRHPNFDLSYVEKVTSAIYGKSDFKTWTDKVNAYRKDVGELQWDMTKDNPDFGTIIYDWNNEFRAKCEQEYVQKVFSDLLPSDTTLSEEEVSFALMPSKISDIASFTI